MKSLFKNAISAFLVLALVIAGVAVPSNSKKAEAASYNACLSFQSTSYYCRDELGADNHSDCIKLKTDDVAGTSVKDVKIKKSKKKKTYTVSVKGLNKCKFTNDENFNTLYVSTDIPQSMAKKVKITNMVVKFDGKKVKSFSKPYMTPEEGSDKLQAVAINSYNDDVKWSIKDGKMPKKSIDITFSITFK